MTNQRAGRELIEREVQARAAHPTAEAVRTTCSFARAERLLGGEYHGRFLIELLQNAADAWRKDARSADAGSRVAVIVTEEPALIVANQGAPLTPEVVIESLGHIGASTKNEGEAIGHKGIGFKSVLEMTRVPEVYSGLQGDEPTLAVRFDPRDALDLIRASSPRWEQFVAGTHGLASDDPFAPIPVLRYPVWVDELPEDVRILAAAGFDTAIRVPFAPDLDRLGLDEANWLQEVRRAIRDDLSDQIILLLGAFAEVTVEDRTTGTNYAIVPSPSSSAIPAVGGTTAQSVEIARTDTEATHWRIYRRSIPGESNLAGEIAVGLRCVTHHDSFVVIPAVEGLMSAPFHLFFPTKIPSGLPFLLHGYFKVDASRKGFHGAAREGNDGILDELALLVRDVVVSTVSDPAIDPASIVNLMASCPEPEDLQAREFGARVLQLLDSEAWLPARQDETRRLAAPAAFLAETPRFTRLVLDVFPDSYVRQQAGLELLSPSISDPGIDLVRARPRDDRDQWSTLGLLCRPGDRDIWPAEAADDGFRQFLKLVNWLRGEHPAECETFLSSLRGDLATRLIPAVAEGGARALLPLSDPSEGVAGQRSRLVMARVRASDYETLVPPPALEVSFLPAGLLASEQEIDQARPLGIRQFTVDNVLDRLNGVGEAIDEAADVLAFLWQFLARERRNQYGTRKVASRATAAFSPAEWFWCRPGRARESNARRLEQQRERYLAGVLLPSRDGVWRPAGELAFGADWAEWVEQLGGLPPATRDCRTAAYRALEAACPDPGSMLLAPPASLQRWLAPLELGSPPSSREFPGPEDDQVGSDDLALELEEALDPDGWRREGHAFLLRLGVWEVLPLVAFESRDRRDGRAAFPWAGATASMQLAASTHGGGWRFGVADWSGEQHHNVYLAEEFRFLWPLGQAAERDARAVAHLVVAGAPLYRSRLNATVFCPGCSDSGGYHTAPRQSSTSDGYPSWLALELHNEPWVPVEVSGVPSEAAVEPVRAWWLDKTPSGQGMLTSPWRFVPVCSPALGITEEIRRLAGITVIEHAGPEELGTLLRELHDRFEAGELDAATSTESRSFVSLHTMVYLRLAELDEGVGAEVLKESKVLCRLGSMLAYAEPSDVRHDDGAFSSYVRHFAGKVSLVVLPRDQARAARTLGLERLTITLRRDGTDEGIDVTSELQAMLGERMPELMTILVHHSLGAQTLTLDGHDFRQRAKRFRQLTVHKVPDLVIHASVEGVDHEIPLGSGRSGDLFLESGATGRPALFHDFDGPGWQDRLRRKVAPYLAAVLDANPYAHTFALFLQSESDGEREEFLHELGVSDADVIAVAKQLGFAEVQDSTQQRRWFDALLATLGGVPPKSYDEDALNLAMADVGLDPGQVQTVLQAGGGDEARRRTHPGSVLRMVNDMGIDLNLLDAELRTLEGEDGLRIGDSSRAFGDWMRAHSRRVVAARSRAAETDQAKIEVRRLTAPSALKHRIDVPLAEVLAPVAELLGGPASSLAEDLATDPLSALARVGGFTSGDELDAAALQLYDEEERSRVLALRATLWKRQIQELAVLLRIRDTDSRSDIRDHEKAVNQVLTGPVDKPTDLAGTVEELFAAQPRIEQAILEALDDSVLSVGPHEEQFRRWAEDAAVTPLTRSKYEAALSAPRGRRVAQLRDRATRLRQAHVSAAVPPGLATPGLALAHPRPAKDATSDDSTPTPIKVSRIKVDTTVDQRKRELGDDAEQWALADAVGTLLDLSDAEREAAVKGVRDLLSHFESSVTSSLLDHAAAAAAPMDDTDEDDLVAALESLLHVAKLSDGFGFDIIAWIKPSPEAPAQAVCVEVKSTSGTGFHLSRNEWGKAKQLSERGMGDQYAVLAVHRDKAGGVPSAMHLLVDPVRLESNGLLSLETDGYIAKYGLE